MKTHITKDIMNPSKNFIFFLLASGKDCNSSDKSISKWHPVKGGIQSKQTFLHSSIVILGL